MKLELTSEAEADMEGIGDRIAVHSPMRAASYVKELRQRCSKILILPHAGAPRPQWGEGIRIVIHGKYLIVHRVRDDTVQILRVVHGSRDLDRLFETEPLEE